MATWSQAYKVVTTLYKIVIAHPYTPIHKVVTTWRHTCYKVETVSIPWFYNLVTTSQACDNLVITSKYNLATTMLQLGNNLVLSIWVYTH